ncbi:Chromatin assembly factor 1 subunit B [Penicillium argentinense]|uniref:Chromatin assembly factor 1 subunit B n=1 Tax=Penicillium argentinense TaxID=1131581 RepID=A0A9W9FN48_9EURO|nr:Chromatin assembly factor 1 subunit B [Penicillium argentinense]KAJ5103269.1 Chromatin assembly factor 1 subunit B [Penicillium argentinense]
MKASPLLISWHNDNAPIYSVHFDPNGKGRLATAGNDNNVRLWRVESTGEERKVTYLSTLLKHTQAVNVVRFCPKGEMLASAGDDGNVLLWVPSELQTQAGLGEDRSDDKETWRVKHMCRSSGAEIYDLAWSPDGVFIMTGSMDNIARIYNAQNGWFPSHRVDSAVRKLTFGIIGQMVRQIAEHSHYVQGVAWDPLNEFVATQSSDRSVHIYSLKTKDGQFTLTPHGKVLKMDLPARRLASSSPAPESTSRPQQTNANSIAIASPAPSTPGTPMASNLPMDPPPVSHSRRSSFGSSPSIRRSASPAPSMPLPAVKPLEVSSPSVLGGLGVKNASIYANETFTSFFRRLTFAPDGSLLFTPAGQYKTTHVSATDPSKTTDEIINTVYVYTRAGFNKPPISHLPGHKKPSVAVKCSPVFYTLKQGTQPAKQITLDTSSEGDMFPPLPDSVVPTAASSTSQPAMEPPSSTPAAGENAKTQPSPKAAESSDTNQGSTAPVFALPYRVVYAVATQDAVLVYDTQQQTPLCVVSNLHFATFTDLTWSNDGLTLIMSSSDGFCSTLSFSPGELGQPYTGPTSRDSNQVSPGTPSNNVTPLPTPTHIPSPVKASHASASSVTPSAPAAQVPPASPARSNSACSQSSTQQQATVVNNPTPTLGSVPLVTATHSAQPLPLTTPPQTPMPTTAQSGTSANAPSVLGKRDAPAASESEKEESKAPEPQAPAQQPKKRRVAPTLISAGTDASSSGSKDATQKPDPAT